MGARVREHVRSNVVGYVALFFALSLGTAYAIDKNSVKSKHIKAGAVKESDLGNGAVSAAKLGENSVSGANVVNDSLKGADVDETSLSLPAGPQGPPGPEGPQGPPGAGGAPSGPAGGSLTGTYPNPSIAGGAVGPGELAGDLQDVLNANDLAPDSVGSSELAPNAAGSSEIQTSSIDFDEIIAGAVRSSEIMDDTVGKADVAAGAVGLIELAGFETVTANVSVPDDGAAGDGIVATRAGEAECGDAAVAVAGGLDWSGDVDNERLFTVESHPSDDLLPDWVARGANDTGVAQSFEISVFCIGL